MTTENQLSVAISFIRISTVMMITLVLLPIIAGPNISHRINLIALLLTFLACLILLYHRKLVDLKRLIIFQIILNIVFGLGHASIKYGYFGWEYKNLTELQIFR